jgi:hypothetical protein
VAGSYSGAGSTGWVIQIHPLDAEDTVDVGNSAWTLGGGATLDSTAQWGNALNCDAVGERIKSDAAISGLDISDTARTMFHLLWNPSDIVSLKHVVSFEDSGATAAKLQFFVSGVTPVLDWHRATDFTAGKPTIRITGAGMVITTGTFGGISGFINANSVSMGKIFRQGTDVTSSVADNAAAAVSATGFDFCALGSAFGGGSPGKRIDHFTLIQNSALTDAKAQALATQYHDTRGFGFRPTFGSLSPSRGKEGDAITLDGAGYGADVAITVGGVAATVTRLNDGRLSFTVPDLGAVNRTADVAITNTEAGVTWTETSAFQYLNVYNSVSERRNLTPITLIVIKTDGGDTRLVDNPKFASPLDALGYFETVSPIGVRLEPWAGLTSVGAITLTMIDKNKFFSKLASSAHLINREVEIRMGYEGMDVGDFFTEYIGKIKGLKQPSPTKWEMTVEDAMADLREKVPAESTTTVVDTAYWTLASVSSMGVASALDSSTIPQLYTITRSFDSTNIRARTVMVRVSASTFRLYQVRSITSGSTFTTWYVDSSAPATDGVANAQRAELLGDNMVDVMLNVMKRVGLPDRNIQVASLIYNRDIFLSSIRVRRTLAKPTPAIDLLRQLSEVSLVSLFPDEGNRISGRYFNYPGPHEEIYTLDTTKINPVGGIVSGPRSDKLANRIVIYGNHDGTQDEKPENYLRVDIYADADAQANNKETRSREIKSFWLHSSVTDSAWYGTLGNRVLDRLKYPPRYASMGTMPDAAKTRVADIVDFSHPDVIGQPAVVGAQTPGVSRELWQILEKRTDAPNGHVDLEIWDAQFVFRAGWIGHAGAADWDTASVEEKRHCYIGDASNLLNTEDGYYIQ